MQQIFCDLSNILLPNLLFKIQVHSKYTVVVSKLSVQIWSKI